MYKLNNGIHALYRYDGINRLNQRKLVLGESTNLYYNYIYKISDRNSSSESKYRTTLVAEEYIGNDVYIYDYDELENITSIKKAERKSTNYNSDAFKEFKNPTDYVTYSYDDLGQLTRENLAGKKTSVWNYDELGNITSKSEYAYTTVEDLKNETVNKTVKYYYPDDKITYQDSTKTTKTYSSWNNILVAVDLDGSNDVADDEIIEYDQIGNPTSYLGATLKWNGRQLTSYKTSDKEISYTYDSNGLRTSKTIKNGVTSDYFYVNGQLHYEERSNGTKLYFFYDSNGYLTGIEYNNTMYYPATNRRGDVVAIYNKTGNCIVKYEYDAWGNVIVVVDDSGINLAEINPIRYRGYYWDSETGFYYLQSRYYDPAIGRFLNADVYVSTGVGILGYNMFAYCNNSPIITKDENGEVLCTLLGATVGALTSVLFKSIETDDPEQLKAAAINGAISGAISGAASDVLIFTGGTAGVFVAVGAVAGGVGSAIGTVAESKYLNEEINGTEVLVSAAIGAGTGALFNATSSGAASIKETVTKTVGKYTAKNVVKTVANDFSNNFTINVVTEAVTNFFSWFLGLPFSD